MGLNMILSGGSTSYTPPAPNPNPKDFKILDIISIKYKRAITVVLVHYPACTTFEGNKIMVFRGNARKYIGEHKLKSLDPHFTASNGLLARFPATDDGMKDAIEFGTWKSKQ